MRLAATLEYDGTEFSGFQRQNNAETIQEHLEVSLKKITHENITINYSGRTDAGVHAISQVFDFKTNIERDEINWIKGINSNLPKSISVKEICSVQDDFNSRFSAIERTYSYVIYNSKEKPLFFDNFCCWVTNDLDINKMNDQILMFIGKNNFSSFRSVNCNSKNPVKLSPSIASLLNIFDAPIWFMSSVIDTPSKSSAVILPVSADVPPIKFELPSCSKSIVAELPV